MIKINFQCGKDIILGYKNYDINPQSPNVEKVDFRTFSGAMPGSVAEIRILNSLELLSLQELFNLLQRWHQMLVANGEIYLQALHGQLIANSFACGNLPCGQYNQMIFGDPNLPNKSTLSIDVLEEMFGQIGFKVITKGIIGHAFFVRISK